MPETWEHIIHPLEWANRLCICWYPYSLDSIKCICTIDNGKNPSTSIGCMTNMMNQFMSVMKTGGQTAELTSGVSRTSHIGFLYLTNCVYHAVFSRGPVIASTFAVEERQHKFCECLSNLCEYPQHILMCSACELMYCFHIDQSEYIYICMCIYVSHPYVEYICTSLWHMISY